MGKARSAQKLDGFFSLPLAMVGQRPLCAAKIAGRTSGPGVGWPDSLSASSVEERGLLLSPRLRFSCLPPPGSPGELLQAACRVSCD